MKQPIPDNDDEPEAICANCEYYVGDIDGRRICVHMRSGIGSPEPTDTCKKFFPHDSRWPGADHD